MKRTWKRGWVRGSEAVFDFSRGRGDWVGFTAHSYFRDHKTRPDRVVHCVRTVALRASLRFVTFCFQTFVFGLFLGYYCTRKMQVGENDMILIPHKEENFETREQPVVVCLSIICLSGLSAPLGQTVRINFANKPTGKGRTLRRFIDLVPDSVLLSCELIHSFT